MCMDFGASTSQAPPSPPPQEHHQQVGMDSARSPQQQHDDNDGNIQDWLDEKHLGDERCYSTSKESLKGCRMLEKASCSSNPEFKRLPGAFSGATFFRAVALFHSTQIRIPEKKNAKTISETCNSRTFDSSTMETRTVRVEHVSDLAGEREIQEFFSFSGEIERIEIQRDVDRAKTAFVTFKDPKALEIALLLSQIRTYDDGEVGVPVDLSIETNSGSPGNHRVYVNKAQDVVSTMIAKGSAIKQDAISKAKAFDEKHQLTATASAKVISFDRRVGLTEKITVGISAVNEKVKSVDQRLHVSDKTMAALVAAERKLNDTGSAVKTSRYVTAGAAWFNGAFGKMAKATQAAGTKTREKFKLAVSNLTATDAPIAA
ncbi:hypothetical protein Scep_003550 [Stephania cephalantha]|uniref:RRM domain-containing protein n=1 Tax=Stephania cephalantha TaxID=152367 RepID=A0AAP0KQU7_9MAGN